MFPDRRMRRRTLLAMSLAAAATSACRRGTGQPAWRTFTAHEARTVDAIAEQLIPADADPGAHAAGVVNYIDLQLSKRLRRHRPLYQSGLEAVDAASRTRFGKTFVDLASEQQVEVLTGIEETSREFFDLILNHTRQGFYGDPRHGGNRNMASWKMLGIPFPPVRGRQHYDVAPKAG